MKDYGLPVSAALHVLIIVGAIFAMPAAAPFEPAVESMPVEIITPEQFQQIAQGEETAKPDPTPQTKAEKVAPQKPVKTVEAPKVQPDATTPTPPSPPKRSVPDQQQVAAAEPVDPPEPPPPPPKPAAVEKPQAAKPAPTPPTPPTPPEPTPPPEPVKQAATPPKPQAKPVPQEDTQKLDDLALKAAQEPEQAKPDPVKPEPVKVKPVKQPPAPPKPEVAKDEPKPVEKPAKPVDKADPKQLEKLLASLKTEQKTTAKQTDDASDDAEKPAPKPPTSTFDPKNILKTLGKHPTTVAAKVASADGADTPDALPSKEPPARAQRTGDKPAETASLGKQDAVAPKLSISERTALVNAIRDQVKGCWNKPVASSDPKSLVVTVEFNLNADGTLSSTPVAHGGNTAAAGAAKRAVIMCVTPQKPLRLPPSLYASWREIEVSFDPSI